MELIQPSDLYFGRRGWIARLQARLIMKVAALKKINRLYESAFSYEGPYPEGLLYNLGVSYDVAPSDLKNIPASGPAIVIANHPTGALDGMILIDLLSKARPDVKFMGNFLLSRIGPLKRFFIDVDPFDAKSGGNVSGIRESLQHLSGGGLLVIFPAGEVATWQRGFRDVKDRPWPESVLKFIRKAQVPVVPVYIEASNSRTFRLAGKVHSMLRTLLLPRELVNKAGCSVPLRIASPILPKKTEDLSKTAYNSYLRASVEYLKPSGRRRPRRAERRFDRYYRQLFIWDNEALRLVGAYRLGLGDEIMRNYGLKGFYTHTLFRMSPPMGEVMSRTIELGRSFIAREYQRKPASLMLLWKGILHVLLQNEQYRYLMGPVTVSGGFQHTSKLIIAAYVSRFYLDRKKASYIRPRTGIVVPARIDESLIAEVRPIELINKIICDIERNAFSIPVLIRKYLQLNSSVLGFNTDHEFCDSLDALMLLDLRRVPEETILMLSKELTDIDVIGRFKKIKD